MFNYESKFMQILMLVADYMILNVLFVLCSIPIFTIGAAQAGLYTGVKTLLDSEDDTPCYRSFFKGFRSGFGTITIVWNIFLVIIVLLGYCYFVVDVFDEIGYAPQVWMIVLALAICAVLQSNLTIFHASFTCTKKQLLKNVFYTCIGHPIRAVEVGFFTWIPVLVFLFGFPIFLQITPVWIVGYYSVAFIVNTVIMKKPFEKITENFVAMYEAENGEIELENKAE